MISKIDQSSPKLVFCFAGQGYVPLEASRDLYRTCSRFRSTIDEIDATIQAAVDNKDVQRTFISLGEYLQESECRPAHVPPFGQEQKQQEGLTTPPAPLMIFAAQYALARTIQSFGLEPTDIVGYSLGEHCASAVTGSLPLPAAIKLLLRREALFADRRLVEKEGGMMTVQLPPEQTASFLSEQGLEGTADISGYPHPKSTILSGNADALDRIHESMNENGVDAQRRAIKFGMHATHVGRVGEELRCNGTIFPKNDSCEARVKPEVAHWSNVSGNQLEPGTALDASYWADHLTTPIHFRQCIEGIYEVNKGEEIVFLDLGMGPRLTRLVQNTLQETEEWKDGRIRAINCIVSTSMGEVEKGRKGWAERTLRESLDKLISE